MSGRFKKRRILDMDKAFELYQQGYWDQYITDNCGVALYTVQKWRKRNGLPANPAPKKPKPEKVVKKSRLSICAAEANKRGLSYGQYMATLYR